MTEHGRLFSTLGCAHRGAGGGVELCASSIMREGGREEERRATRIGIKQFFLWHKFEP